MSDSGGTGNGLKTSISQLAPLARVDLSEVLRATLPRKGLDRITTSRVEEVVATSAVPAHI